MIVVLLPTDGFDPTEAAVPWRAAVAAGHEVRFATPDGRASRADERLVTTGFGPLDAVLMTTPAGLTAYAAMVADPAFATPMRHDEVVLGDGDALLVPGGHAQGVRTLVESSAAQAVVVEAFARGLPVAAICHGVLLLARSVDPASGRSVLHGRRTTALTRGLELGGWWLTRWWLGGYYRTYPRTVQEEVTAALAAPADFSAGPPPLRRDSVAHPERGYAVRDGRYVSARWPGDVHAFTAELLDLLGAPA